MIISGTLGGETIKRNKDGFSVDRDFYISEVGGNAGSKLYTAVTMGGIPQYGDPHPTIPGIQVTSVSAEPYGGGSQIRVSVSYSVPTVDETSEIEADDDTTSGTVVLSSNTASETVFQDINGELLKATYGVLQADGSNTTLQTKYAEADVERPQLRVDFSRTENTIPKAAINTYLGTVNSVPWSGYPPKTWLCTAISARQNKGKYDVEYSFNYRPETWELEVVVGLTAEEAQDLPIDVDSGNGYARFDVYRLRDFNGLGLVF